VGAMRSLICAAHRRSFARLAATRHGARGIHWASLAFSRSKPQWQSEDEAVLIVKGKQLPTRDGRVVYSKAAAAVPAEVVRFANGSMSAIAADDVSDLEAALGGPVEWQGLRDFVNRHTDAFGAVEEEAASVAAAASLLKWNRSNAYAGSDGFPTHLASPDGKVRKTAPTTEGSRPKMLFPRTDPVAIVLVESHDGARCLLGRQAAYTKGMYTCISGFVDFAESAERAAAREVLEETAVVCDPASVRLVASQAWPVGRGDNSELMLACTARAASDGEEINTSTGMGGGGELEDARWFTRPQIALMLRNGAPDWPLPEEGSDDVSAEEACVRSLATPPPIAVAHHLIRQWLARG